MQFNFSNNHCSLQKRCKYFYTGKKTKILLFFVAITAIFIISSSINSVDIHNIQKNIHFRNLI